MIAFDLFEDKDRDRSRIRDTATRSAVIKARARHTSATSDIEALAKDLLDKQEQDEQQLAQAQETNARQDELLKQIRALDRRQDAEIDKVEAEEDNLEHKIKMLRAANEKLLQTVDNMRSRKKPAADTISESGPETWTVYFTDGTKTQIRVPNDETEPTTVRAYFAKKGKTVDKFDYGFNTEPTAGPGPEAHEPGSGTAVGARTGERLPEADTFNRGGNNKLRDKNDYHDKREHLSKQLDTPGYSYADRQAIRDRMMQLEKATSMQGYTK